MRREGRRLDKKDGFGTWIYVLGSVLGILMIVFAVTFSIYSNRVKNNSNVSMLNTTRTAELVPSVTDMGNSQTASTDMGKTVNEMQNEMNNVVEQTSTNTTGNTTSTPTANIAKETPKEEPKKELSFEKPVEGEIIVGFAKDSLVYSNTLQEWMTHKGIDIKADKTTVVKAAEAGVVKSIKNDPRYGLTIIIEHENGYKTIYSSLLSAEFVVEGEKVEKGQTIGTIGSSAIFESAEEPHLHFELIKDNEYLDPTIYLK